ncbi:MAG TPA: hypothetical protein VEK57_01225 [Thermoanaerobaculia bacterium]|nr:hypothetical protein [Thermoanaerobaculia bacterium]
MRAGAVAVLSWLLSSGGGTAAQADELGCGTSVENTQRVLALHQRSRDRAQVAAQHAGHGPELRDGAFYVEADENIIPGYRPFDLQGQSLVFEPRSPGKYAVRRETLRYREPSAPAVHDFQTGARTYTYALGTPFATLGRPVSRIYITAFNGIYLDEPAAEPGMTQFDSLETMVHRQALVSPLMITNRKPSRLAFAQLFVEENVDGVAVTWRSTAGVGFGYDVQAELRRDGSIVFSYKSMREMKWGAPVVSTGFDPATAPRRVLHATPDAVNETTNVREAVRGMLDVANAEVSRIGETEVFALRLKLAVAPDVTKLAPGERLRYSATLDGVQSAVEIDAAGIRVAPFGSSGLIPNGSSARLDGDVLEIYGLQPAPGTQDLRTFRVATFLRPSGVARDLFNFAIPFDVAQRRVAVDLSLAASHELTVPIAEPFTLAPFNPYEVWERLQPAFGMTDHSVDAVAMYQSFYTDIIFYAGAYATWSNPQVDGIAPEEAGQGSEAPRTATLLHMNQLTYGYQSAEKTSSQVMLHELGHRWLYFFSIRDNGGLSNVLNPTTAHPAAYVDTRSAFKVYADEESSTMGGGFFTMQGDGTWKARALNAGYSWTDLYLMGLAAPDEVQPWFYLSNTNPTLPDAYWPQDGIVVQGTRRNVNVGQIIDAHGPRNPSAATSQKEFRVAFVLVTEPNKQPTPAEMAKLNEWRRLLERNFALATGGRGRLTTSYVRTTKRRGVGRSE